MNEWMLVGIVVVGTLLILGGGSWLMRVLGAGRKDASTRV